MPEHFILSINALQYKYIGLLVRSQGKEYSDISWKYEYEHTDNQSCYNIKEPSAWSPLRPRMWVAANKVQSKKNEDAKDEPYTTHVKKIMIRQITRENRVSSLCVMGLKRIPARGFSSGSVFL